MSVLMNAEYPRLTRAVDRGGNRPGGWVPGTMNFWCEPVGLSLIAPRQ